MSLWMQSLLIAAGGALGALTRFWAGVLIVRIMGGPAPLATLTVNVVGCGLAGLLLGRLTLREPNVALQALLLIGFLGGLTTFSSFSLDALSLWRSGSAKWAWIYVAASVGLSLIAAALGFAWTRR